MISILAESGTAATIVGIVSNPDINAIEPAIRKIMPVKR